MTREPDRCTHCDSRLWDVPSPWPRCPVCRMPFCSAGHLQEHLSIVTRNLDPVINAVPPA